MKKNWILILLVSILTLSVVVSTIVYFQSKNTLIPSDILSKINFLIYYPNDENSWTTDTSRTSFDSEAGVLSLYPIYSNNTIVLTQQSSPEVFKDVPEQYQRLLDTLNQYSEITTSFGTVTLTKPDELNGGQSAIANLNGTLLFAKPNRELTNQEWQIFFKSIEVVR